MTDASGEKRKFPDSITEDDLDTADIILEDVGRTELAGRTVVFFGQKGTIRQGVAYCLGMLQDKDAEYIRMYLDAILERQNMPNA